MSKGRHIHKREEARRRRIAGEAPEPPAVRQWVGPEADAVHLEMLRRANNAADAEGIKDGTLCAESVDRRHGPAGGDGRCPWCGLRYTHVAPRAAGPHPLTELEIAYRRTYDPDFWE